MAKVIGPGKSPKTTSGSDCSASPKTPSSVEAPKVARSAADAPRSNVVEGGSTSSASGLGSTPPPPAPHKQDASSSSPPLESQPAPSKGNKAAKTLKSGSIFINKPAVSAPPAGGPAPRTPPPALAGKGRAPLEAVKLPPVIPLPNREERIGTKGQAAVDTAAGAQTMPSHSGPQNAYSKVCETAKASLRSSADGD